MNANPYPTASAVFFKHRVHENLACHHRNRVPVRPKQRARGIVFVEDHCGVHRVGSAHAHRRLVRGNATLAFATPFTTQHHRLPASFSTFLVQLRHHRRHRVPQHTQPRKLPIRHHNTPHAAAFIQNKLVELDRVGLRMRRRFHARHVRVITPRQKHFVANIRQRRVCGGHGVDDELQREPPRPSWEINVRRERIAFAAHAFNPNLLHRHARRSHILIHRLHLLPIIQRLQRLHHRRAPSRGTQDSSRKRLEPARILRAITVRTSATNGWN
mmetsp:Transcript_1164/g.2332  ORF Transcript_1164/g.2332 Transcript_1164/m.2332 type:complete len:271 (+) Transcript_1164:497-1309(+)